MRLFKYIVNYKTNLKIIKPNIKANQKKEHQSLFNIQYGFVIMTFLFIFFISNSAFASDKLTTYQLSKKLNSLSYLTNKDITSDYTYKVRNAVMAFQKYQGITVDGVAGSKTYKELKKASRPKTRYKYRHLEARLDKQILLVVNSNGKVTRTINISSGKPGYNTPKGNYKIYRKVINDYSRQYNSPMPYSSYFIGGYAFHESSSVPNYAASHGCIRIPAGFSQDIYKFASLNTRVLIR